MDDKMPRRSYELIALLDEITDAPAWPTSPRECRLFDKAAQRQAIFQAGARHCVDQLVRQVEEEISDPEIEGAEVLSVGDEAWGRIGQVFGPDGNVREFLSSLRVAGSDAGRKLGARLRG